MKAKIIETTEEMRRCKKIQSKNKSRPEVFEDHLTTRELYDDGSIRYTCHNPDCGRRSYTIFVKASNRKKEDSPDWLKTWQEK